MRLKNLFLLSCLFCIVAPSHAQIPGFGKKKPASDKAPEYSDADKQKMAQIEQRPDVQASIQKQWDEIRKADITAAHNMNLTATWAVTDDLINHSELKNASSSTDFGRLYSNPMMQMYVNEIGQRLVPRDSPNEYTFRIILEPLPQAFALTTGSIYISTGLLSMLDSEAQLSYILAHEIAHVEQKHAYARIRNSIVEEKLNEEKAEKAKMIGTLAGVAGGALLGAKGGSPLAGAALGGVVGNMLGDYFGRRNLHETDWSVVEENEADEYGAKYMLDQGYDVREVPRLYASLDRLVGKDSRVGLGFMGNPQRVKERTGHIQEMINGSLKPQLEKLVARNGVKGSGANFPVLLAAAKRDNGITALQSDLFAMAKQNLEDALAQRSNDPTVHFYLSRVYTLTARTPEDQRTAVDHIANAMRLDAVRGSIPDLHLEMAMSLLMMNNDTNKAQIVNELKTYVALYQRDNSGALPANMSAIFDYFNLVGETGWYLPPQWYPATQLNNSGPSTLAPAPTVQKASLVGGGGGAMAGDNAITPSPAPQMKQTSSPSRRK